MTSECTPPDEQEPANETQPNDNQQSIAASLKSFVNEYKADNTKSNSSDNLKETWNIRTAIGVFIYTGLTAVIMTVGICQLNTSRDMEKRQLRAYSSFMQMGFAPDRSVDPQFWQPQVNWQNTGDTPTVRAKSKIHIEITSKPLKDDFEPSDRPEDVAYPHSMSPKGYSTTFSEKPISTEDMLAAKDQKKFIYAWGWVSYEDVFPKSDMHETRFFVKLVITGDFVHDPKNFNHFWFYRPTYNCTDDECKKQ